MSVAAGPNEFSREVKALAPLDDSNWQKQIASQIYGPKEQNSTYQNSTYQNSTYQNSDSPNPDYQNPISQINWASADHIVGHSKTLVDGGRVTAHFGSLVIADNGAEVAAGPGSRVRASNSLVEAWQGSKIIAGDGANVYAGTGSFVLGENGSTTTASGANVLLKSGGRAIADTDSHIVAEAGAQVMALSGSSVYLENGASAIVSNGAHVSGPGAKNALHMVADDLIVAPAGSKNNGIPLVDHIQPPGPTGTRAHDGLYADYQREAGITNPDQFSNIKVIVSSGATFNAQDDQPFLTIADRGSTVSVDKAVGTVVATPGSHVRVEQGGKVYAYAGAEVSGKGEKASLKGTYLGAAEDHSMLGLTTPPENPYAVYQLPTGDSKPPQGFYMAPANSKVEAGAGTVVEALGGSKVNATNGSNVIGFNGSETLAHSGAQAVLNPGAVALADAGSKVAVHLHGIAWAHAGAKTDAHREWTGGGEDFGSTFWKDYRTATVVPMEKMSVGLMQQAHLLPGAKPGTFQELDKLLQQENQTEDNRLKLHDVMEKVTFGLDWQAPYLDLNQ